MRVRRTSAFWSSTCGPTFNSTTAASKMTASLFGLGKKRVQSWRFSFSKARRSQLDVYVSVCVCASAFVRLRLRLCVCVCVCASVFAQGYRPSCQVARVRVTSQAAKLQGPGLQAKLPSCRGQGYPSPMAPDSEERQVQSPPEQTTKSPGSKERASPVRRRDPRRRL